MELWNEASGLQRLKTTKLQSTKQYGTGTKTHTEVNRQEEPRNKPTNLQLINLQQGRQENNGEKTVSSINGARQSEQLHVKE